MAKRSAVLEVTQESLGGLGVIAPIPIHVQTPTFSGSLAALFHCVRERKIDLRDVPLFPVCQTYFEYLLTLPNANLEEAAAALAALAYLIERKAWSLLPLPEAEPEPYEEELAALGDLPSYDLEEAIETLQRWERERERSFFRTAEPTVNAYEVPYELDAITLADIARAFEQVLARSKPEPLQPLGRPRLSLAEVMKLLISRLPVEPTTLLDIVPEDVSKADAVFWFLAILELVRLGQISILRDEDQLLFGRATRT